MPYSPSFVAPTPAVPSGLSADASSAQLQTLIDASEAGANGLVQLCQRALDLRAGATPLDLSGKRVAALFMNPSLRTRTSLAAACHAVGAHLTTVDAGSDSWKLEFEPGAVMDADKAEHVADAAQVLSHYHDLLAVRAFAGLQDQAQDRADTVVQAFAQHAQVPFMSLESAVWHPLQGLADSATWLSHLGQGGEQPLRGRKITLTWAPHPKALGTAVGHQVALSAALLGMDLTIAHPEGFDLDPLVVQRASDMAVSAGGSLQVSHDQDDALQGAEVVVAKSWGGTSFYGNRDAETALRAQLGSWMLDADKMALTADAGFMHCLPVRRNVVVADEVIDGPNSWVQETAALRMWTAIAALEKMLG